MTIYEILQQYWGFTRFRPMQEDVVRSVLAGKDTLALLPTGGGKSLCFQVPAMAKKGICIVVSPLIALMKDQVFNLQRRGIQAVALYSGMPPKEMDILLNNCVYGQIKFLYVSPERLKTRLFLDRLRSMDVNLLAIDEAHCISQWGYDFRPPYLEIAEVRELIPDVPVLALTATATPEVVQDIMEKLKFREKNLLQKSFYRPNLIYKAYTADNKPTRLAGLLDECPGSAVVYVRNRKRTRMIAEFLEEKKISAGYYHAGLNAQERSARQDAWIQNQLRVIVATNAFGMGIDKPDVRLVVHMDIPDSLEAYFQEAGRAGRDEQEAQAVVLFSGQDMAALQENFEKSYPPQEEIKRIYDLLCNYLNVAIGAGQNESFTFDPADFCQVFGLDMVVMVSALGFLERLGILVFSDMAESYSQVKVLHTPHYERMLPKETELMQLMLRVYEGLFDQPQRIRERYLGLKLKWPEKDVVKVLQTLQQKEWIDYKIPRSGFTIVLTSERLTPGSFSFPAEIYQTRKEVARKKLDAVISYFRNDTVCRSRQLLAYFGEKEGRDCGKCDICRQRITGKGSVMEMKDLLFRISEMNHSIFPLDQLLSLLPAEPGRKAELLRWLVDEKFIRVTEARQVVPDLKKIRKGF